MLLLALAWRLRRRHARAPTSPYVQDHNSEMQALLAELKQELRNEQVRTAF